MGRKAIRTGDLVVSRTNHLVLWRFAEGNQLYVDSIVDDFTMGLVIGTHRVTYYARQFNDRPRTKTMVLVLDSQTQKYGWANITWIKRVD